MAIDILQTLDVIETMENYIARVRPPEDIRHLMDLSYKIEGQSVIIFEIRPQPELKIKPQSINPKLKMECPIAKATFVKTKNNWKVFWLRANNKWDSYPPEPEVKNLKDFTRIVEEDKHHCFWG